MNWERSSSFPWVDDDDDLTKSPYYGCWPYDNDNDDDDDDDVDNGDDNNDDDDDDDDDDRRHLEKESIWRL